MWVGPHQGVKTPGGFLKRRQFPPPGGVSPKKGEPTRERERWRGPPF